MYVLMTANKQLLCTGENSPIYKYETGIDDIKFLIPKIYNGINIEELKCIVQCLLPVTKDNVEQEGIYKLCNYDLESYSDNMLKVTLPITTTLTKEVGTATLWLLFIKENEENENLASNVLKTSKCEFDIVDNGSLDSESESEFDEIWEHSSIDAIQEQIKVISETKADSIEIKDKTIILKSGDNVLNTVPLEDDVIWKEWI